MIVSLSIASPHSSGPLFLTRVLQSVHDVFVRLKTRVGHVYNRRQEDVEQEGREHARLAQAMFYSEPPRAHPVVEPRACSHAMGELINNRDHILRGAKTVECCSEEGSIKRFVRFGKVDKA